MIQMTINMPDWSVEISIFECNICNRSWDDYECNRKLRLRKCSICHASICKSCFFDAENKQHCRSCQLKYVPKKIS